ncbi:ORF6N domain-containing protein [Clostridium fallax]|uniref:ORF6N domain-containing protein n=1 Tax=Clostridium fallax TaxID=1533 RepID=A0A1M4UXQ6_9CLOT|nr:ORF6N domain-containing protein [Clostridium fallax]SHE61430.1 ORF6N domain-containing protein [Clostridium fallax]SQB06756.1 phage anti-repressor [Clostridium fallax]
MGNLIPLEFKNQIIITTKVLAEEFGTEEKNIQMNFSNNQFRFKEGKHFIKLNGQVLKDFKNSLPNEIREPIKFAPTLYLWTEKGVARHAKILDTDKAWDVYEELEETYFRVKEGKTNLDGLSPQLQALINIELNQKKLEEKINLVREENKEEIEAMRSAITLDSNGWRKETTAIINKIANKLGGFSQVNLLKREIYKLLDTRLGVDVNRRLLEKQKRMALEGVCKSKINKTNVLDVIAEDKKLIDGYVNIIRQYALKYGV